MAFLRKYELKSVNFPKVTTIGNAAFSDCENLISVNLPKVTMIGKGAFASCKSLPSINFPAVREIGERAFEYCKNLRSAIFPEVMKVGDYAFFGGAGPMSLVVPAIPPALGSETFTNGPLEISILDDNPTTVFKRYAEYDEWAYLFRILGMSRWKKYIP
jgi:hypothetical protein